MFLHTRKFSLKPDIIQFTARWRNGLRDSLKNYWSQDLVGSTPTLATKVRVRSSRGIGMLREAKFDLAKRNSRPEHTITVLNHYKYPLSCHCDPDYYRGWQSSNLSY